MNRLLWLLCASVAAVAVVVATELPLESTYNSDVNAPPTAKWLQTVSMLRNQLFSE